MSVTHLNRLNVDGKVKGVSSVNFPLRIEKASYDWIKANTSGSMNSVMNALIRNSIRTIGPILEEMPLNEKI